MLYLIEAGSVIVRPLSGVYSREPYWKDIVSFEFVIARRGERSPCVCATTDDLLLLRAYSLLYYADCRQITENCRITD